MLEREPEKGLLRRKETNTGAVKRPKPSDTDVIGPLLLLLHLVDEPIICINNRLYGVNP